MKMKTIIIFKTLFPCYFTVSKKLMYIYCFFYAFICVPCIQVNNIIYFKLNENISIEKYRSCMFQRLNFIIKSIFCDNMKIIILIKKLKQKQETYILHIKINSTIKICNRRKNAL